MVSKSSKFVTLKDEDIATFCRRIYEENIFARKIEVEYNNNKKTLVTRVDGVTSLALTTPFLDSIASQLKILREDIISPLVEMNKSSFVIIVMVDSKGNFSFNDLQIIYKIDCRNRGTLHDKFRLPFKVLIPFTEYIDYISIRGHEHEIAVIEAEINVSQLDLLAVIEQPFAGPLAQKQWYNFAVEASNEAKKEYKIDVVIPVNEGEVSWNVPQRKKLQHFELVRGEKK